jgi:hypothetical protein
MEVEYIIIVHNSSESAELQKFLFTQGYSWAGSKSTRVQFTESRYIVMWSTKKLTYGPMKSVTPISVYDYLPKYNTPLYKVLNGN